MRGLIATALVLLLAVPVFGQEASGDGGKRIDGIDCRVELHTGRRVRGVVRQQSIWERPTRTEAGFGWETVDRDHPEAGVRLWYVNMLDGYVFIKQSHVAEIESFGALSVESSDAIVKATEQGRLAAKAERARLLEERKARIAAERAAAEAAESAAAEGEEGASAESGEATAEADGAADVEQLASLTALLVRFPPSRWSLDTPQKVEHRRVILGLAPSSEEKEFLEVFEEWKKAYTIWRQAQDAEAKPASGTTDS